MAQLDEALNSILGNQQAMAQIMALANSLSEEGGTLEEGVQQGEELPALHEEEPGDSLLNEEEPRADQDLVLLQAVSPFLKPERQEKLEQALELVRMLRLFRGALGGGE